MWMRLISGHREVCLCGLDRCVCRWAAARPVSDAACCLWPHGRSGCRRVRPPARSPHASLRLGVVDLEARPSPPDPPAPSTPVGLFIAVHIPSRPRRPRAPPPSPAARLRGPRGALYARACGSEWSISKLGYSLPPPTGTHRHRGQAPRASRCPQQRAVPGVLVGDRRRFEARLCPAPPTGTAVGHQPGAVCPALVSNLARWGVQH